MNDARGAYLAEASQQRGECFMAPVHIGEASLRAPYRPLRRHPLGHLVDRAEIIGVAAIEVMVEFGESAETTPLRIEQYGERLDRVGAGRVERRIDRGQQ